MFLTISIAPILKSILHGLGAMVCMSQL
jgi:hypothetical protein